MAGQDDGYGWDLKIRCVCELDSFLHYWKFIAFMAIKLGLILFTALYQAVVSLHHICIPNGVFMFLAVILIFCCYQGTEPNKTL